MSVLTDGRPALVLEDVARETEIRLVPQRSYSPSSATLRSISFSQRPDIAVEISTPSATQVLLFDPKYKLQSEETEGEQADAKPKKVDIDAMHAYRDAIRGSTGERAVRFASILYPGSKQTYGPGLGALRADPAEPSQLRSELAEIFERFLNRTATTGHEVAA